MIFNPFEGIVNMRKEMLGHLRCFCDVAANDVRHPFKRWMKFVWLAFVPEFA